MCPQSRGTFKPDHAADTVAVCTGADYQAALDAGSEVPFVSGGPKYEFPYLEPTAGSDEDLGLQGQYAIASPVILPLGAIERLSKTRPNGVPILGFGMGVGIDSTAPTTPANPDWVFPVVDPILIAENLGRKYYEACDAFLAASQDFDRPAARNQDETSSRKEGEILALKKAIADNLVALRRAAPTQASVFDAALRLGQPDQFIEEYRKKLDELAFQRELAAFTLIAWLETEVFQVADDFWPRDDGTPGPTYEAYVAETLEGLARLAESARGLKYLSDVRTRVETASSPVPSGVLHVTTEFMFRDTKSSNEQRKLALRGSSRVFSVWSSFVTASISVQQRIKLVEDPDPTTTLIEDLRAFAKRLENLFHARIVEVEVETIPVEVAKAGRLRPTIVDVQTPSFLLGKDAAAALSKTKLTTTHISRICAILNLGIAYQSLRKTLERHGDERAKHMAMSSLAGAGLGVVAQAVKLRVLDSFRQKMAGKLNTDATIIGNRAAGLLGLLGAVTSLISASYATAEEYERGDWDEAAARFTEGVGALLVFGGQTLILVSGTTGPFALWTLAIGAGLSTAGFIWSVFAADTELDQMLKFCAFGKQAGEAAIKPPGWSQCEKTFAEWNPRTVDGLVRQLKAFQQVFYSFEASGAEAAELAPLASDGILRITPSSLRLACSFQIEYTAVYLIPGPGSDATKKTLNGKVTVQIPTTAVEKFSLVDPSGNYETEGAGRPHRDGGRDALDVRFRLTKSAERRLGKGPFELESLQCLVQLKVPGAGIEQAGNDDAPLIVPTTSKGQRAVKVQAIEDRETKTRTERSLNVDA